jgi:hypothetical protein
LKSAEGKPLAVASRRSLDYLYVAPDAEIALGSAWAGNSVNCVPFRMNGIVTRGARQFVAFYDAMGRACIGMRSLRRKKFGILARLKPSIPPHDAHRAISVECDSRGRLHVLFGAHASGFDYAWTPNPSDLRAWQRSRQLTGVREDQFTYPMFVRMIDGELVLLYRYGRWYSGELCLKRWSCDGNAWTDDELPLISGMLKPWSSGPYVNTPIRDAKGNFHLFYVWRQTPAAQRSGEVVNIGLDYARLDRKLRTLHTSRGVKLSRPITPVNSERVFAIGMGDDLMNQGSAAIRHDNAVAAASFWRDGKTGLQIRLALLKGTQAQVFAASDITTDAKLSGRGTLPLPISRPELLFFPDGAAIVIFRSRENGGGLVAHILEPPDYDLAGAARLLLVGQDLGRYEPVIDRVAWTERGTLSLYVQKCAQARNGDEGRARAAAPASVLEWKAVRLRAVC